jgi:hypothetical protein
MLVIKPLPEQLYNYLVFDGPLPAKPILITFDDTRRAVAQPK